MQNDLPPLTEAALVSRDLMICDQCGEDFGLAEQMCIRVEQALYLDNEHSVQGELICIECVHRLEVTGCRFERRGYDGHYVQDPLGTDEPPPDWPYRRPNPREVLDALRGPLPARLDFRRYVPDL